MTPHAPAARAFLVERMALAFAFNRRAAAINGALALLSAWALHRSVPGAQLLAWLAAVALALALRLAVGEARRLDPEADRHAARWARRIAWAVGSSGLAWGLGAAVMIDRGDALREAFWVIAICGIGTGAVSALRFHQPALWAYLLPLLLPLVLRFASGPHPADLGVAGGLALFLVFCLIQGRSAALALHDSLAIRAENARLVAELTVRHREALEARGLAEAAAAAKARFFAAASHDLRQPLQALVLLDAALAQAKPEQQPALQARLSSGIRTLDRLFEAVLAVSALQARAATPAQAQVPLAELGQTLLERYGPLAEARGQRLLLRHTTDRVMVPGDPAALERLLGNLVANALRFTPAGGCVLLAWRRADAGAVRLQVRDNGCGIAPADQARVFEAFYQVGNAHRDREAGTGLGLAIAQRLSQDLGGRLSLRSAVGQGCCFELRLAAAAEPHTPEGTAPPTAAPVTSTELPPQRVWVVDDDALVREALAALLSGWGLDVLAVEHPDALPHAPPAPPHWLLCDRMLPGVDGLEAAQAVQQRLQPPPQVALLSGLRDEAAIALARQRGWVWLDKPVRPMALRALLAARGTDRD